MKCPFCGSLETQVIDSRVSETGDAIRRRRKCMACDKRFTTFETVEMRMPQVIKGNSTRIDFNVEKIRTGFNRALHKRFVPTEFVDQAIARIVANIHSLGEREIPSRSIGEMVMAELYKLDKVAYIRFASVYKSFQDVEDFRSALHEVERPLSKLVKKPAAKKPKEARIKSISVRPEQREGSETRMQPSNPSRRSGRTGLNPRFSKEALNK